MPQSPTLDRHQRHGLTPECGTPSADRRAILRRKRVNVGGGVACKMRDRDGRRRCSGPTVTPQKEIDRRIEMRKNDPMEAIGILTCHVHGTGQSNAKITDKGAYTAFCEGHHLKVTLDRVCPTTPSAMADIPIRAARWKQGDLFTIASFKPSRKPRAQGTRTLMASRVEVHGESAADRVWVEALSQVPHGATLTGDNAVHWAYDHVVNGKGVGCVWQMKSASTRS